MESREIDIREMKIMFGEIRKFRDLGTMNHEIYHNIIISHMIFNVVQLETFCQILKT